MKQKERAELYVDDFGWILLLAFIITGDILCILYPIFGFLIILTLLFHKNRE